jgi:NAD(P)-dependent dehydrogenase (short-subunit alcohol dehydrogenase family)/AcrR family transcriptional regulator
MRSLLEISLDTRRSKQIYSDQPVTFRPVDHKNGENFGMDAIPTTIKSRRRVQEKREQIVLAAIKKFPQKGFIKTTLRDLAEASGISHANIYDYVGNKEDIFLLVHDFITGLADQALDLSMEGHSDPLEKLKRMIRAEFGLSYSWADAILTIYQDIHVLKKPLLRELLKKESNHVAKFKKVLEECVDKGLLRSCNTRLTANLIKIMIDSYVIKRWDLKGIGRAEMETSILNLVLNGLLDGERKASKRRVGVEPLEGKSVLLLNGGTAVARAISSFFRSKGARLGIYTYGTHMSEIELTRSLPQMHGKIRVYSAEKNGEMTPSLFKQIVKDFGQIDIFVQDLGTNGLSSDSDVKTDENFRCAREISNALGEEMSNRRSGKILFLAPWSWYAHINPLRYETAKAEAIAMTRSLAGKLSQNRVNVNCIVPGYIMSKDGLSDEDEGFKELLNRVGNKRRLGEMEDIVEVTYFLVSDSAKYLTGQVLTVDGGMQPSLQPN